MNKIVINKSHYPYWPSDHITHYLFDKYGIDNVYQLSRHDRRLIEAVEYCIDHKLETGNNSSRLKIVEIESNRYFIEDYDNFESVIVPESLKWVVIDE